MERSVIAIAAGVLVVGCGAGVDTEAAYFIDGPIDGPCAYTRDDEYVVSAFAPTTIADSLGVLANDECVANNIAYVDIDVAHGSLALGNGGGFTYTPLALPYWCSDRFDYRATNTINGDISYAATVTLVYDNTDCGRRVWRAYDRAPYIYKGCPEPGPQPWADQPSFAARADETSIEVDLSTDVPLSIAVTDAPSNGEVYTSSYGFAFVPTTTTNSRDTVGLRITHGACSYDVTAEVTTGS